MAEAITLGKMEMPEEGKFDENLVDCRNCGRHFAADRIETHEFICLKQKPRKPFDVAQQRIRGTEAEKFYKKGKTRSKSEKPGLPQKNWRKEHEDLITSMRAAREMAAHLKRGGNLRDLPPPPRSDYSDYIQCPHCLRRFNHAAAERHISKCATMLHNKTKPNIITNSSKTITPKPTLSARTRK